LARAASEASPRKRLPPEERRAQLLATALEVFARRGFGRAGHAEIAEAAGVAVSTVFVYFKTREALVGAVLAEVGRFYLELALEIHAQPKPCRQILIEHRQITDALRAGDLARADAVLVAHLRGTLDLVRPG